MATARRLLLWDVDHTLVNVAGLGFAALLDAFVELTGVPMAEPPWLGNGHTDLHMATTLFTVTGLDPAAYLPEFFDRYTALLEARGDLIRQRGRVMPGVRALTAALGELPYVTQTLVTGNVRRSAEVKLRALGVADRIEFDIGGYGDEDLVRATLVRNGIARTAAAYGSIGEVLVIGDTVHDVQGALAAGVTAIGVATGTTSTAELSAAGAHEVLESLADVPAALALLGGTR